MGPLDRRQPSRPTDDERLGREIDRRPTFSPLAVGRTGQAREVEPIWDHDDFLRRRDAQPDQVVTHLVADGDDRARRACEHPLDADEYLLSRVLK